MQLQNQIFDKALEYFKEKGLDFTMDELASSLKISKRTLYQKVGNKEAIIELFIEKFKEDFFKYFNKISSNSSLSSIDKFEEVLCYFDINLFFMNNQLNSIKVIYPKVYEKVIVLLDYVWDNIFTLLEKYNSNNITLSYDKEVFRFIYTSISNELSNMSKKDPTLNFESAKRKIVSQLISGIISSNSEYFGGIILQRLLGNLKMGIAIFSANDVLTPLYLSPTCHELFDKIIDEQKQYLNNIFNYIKKEQECNKPIKEINYEYCFHLEDMNICYSLKGVPINYGDEKNVFLGIITDVTEAKKSESKLKLSEEKFKLAVDQSPVHIWEYDHLTSTLTLSDQIANTLGIDRCFICNEPSIFFDRQIVHVKSKDDFVSFFEAMFNGAKEGDCVVRFLNKNCENYYFAKVSYKTIFDDLNKAIYSIGIIRFINTNIEVETKFSQEEHFAKLLENELLFSLQYNVFKDNVIKVITNNQVIKEKIEKVSFTYDQFFKQVYLSIFNENEKKLFTETFSRQAIIDAIAIGKNYLRISFRSANVNGNVTWKNCIANILTEPYSGNYFMFIYIIDIDKKHKLELALPEKIEYDIVSRLYIESTTKKLVNFAITQEEDLTKDCALTVIEFVNLSSIKLQYGLSVAEKIIYHLSRVLKICFGNQNIVGRISTNHIVIFFPVVKDLYELRTRINEVIATAHNSYILSSEEEKIAKIYYSTYVSSLEYANYNILYDKAVKQLSVLKDQVDSIVDSVDNIESYLNYTSYDYDYNEIYSNNDDSNEINDIVCNVISIISNIKDSRQIIKKVCEKINAYYSAYRTSIFILDNKNNKVDVTYEYTLGDEEKFEHKSYFLDDIPSFNYMSARQQPVIIKTNYANDELMANYYKVFRENNVNLFYAIPLVEKNQTFGYLGVSNATDHLGELKLLTILSNIVGNELTKNILVEREKINDEYDSISGLLNYKYFRKTISRYKNMVLSSLGIGCIGINNLRQINIDHGTDYGDSIISAIGKILNSKFRKDSVFRYDSETFEVVVPDLDYNTFTARFNQVVEEISKISSGIINVGQTWSDTDIDIERMLIHAEEVMKINKNASKKNHEFKNIDNNLTNLKEALDEGWFTFFLQPKIDLKTNQVKCAEALVRMTHPNYGLIPPAKIIPILEKNNLVSIIDFYVLEQVCKTLKRWKEEGKPLIQIAVNYSRITMLEQDITIRTINMIRKYNVDPSLIEIEVTETIGNMEQTTIAEIADKFIKAGINIALDDFGSKYSSLSTLSIIPFKTVKLDKSIINDLTSNKRSQLIIESVIKVCKELNMKSVGEGIETEKQFQLLKKMGCDYGQGFYFGKPIPIKDFEDKFL